MAGFNVADFNAAVTKISGGLQQIRDKTPELEPAAARAAAQWYVPDIIGEGLRTMARWAANMAKFILDKIIDVIQGLTAPIKLYTDSQGWGSIQTVADTVSGDIGEEQLKASIGAGYWQGPAVERYLVAAKPQATAATKVASMAGKINSVLITSAVAGAVFYVGLAFVIGKFIFALISAIAEFGVVIASLFGLATILEEFASVPAAIAALVATLVAVLGPQIQELISGTATLNSNNGIPGGHWPPLASGTYSDASVKKQKDAPWSVRPGHDKEN